MCACTSYPFVSHWDDKRDIYVMPKIIFPFYELLNSLSYPPIKLHFIHYYKCKINNSHLNEWDHRQKLDSRPFWCWIGTCSTWLNSTNRANDAKHNGPSLNRYYHICYKCTQLPSQFHHNRRVRHNKTLPNTSQTDIPDFLFSLRSGATIRLFVLLTRNDRRRIERKNVSGIRENLPLSGGCCLRSGRKKFFTASIVILVILDAHTFCGGDPQSQRCGFVCTSLNIHF